MAAGSGVGRLHTVASPIKGSVADTTLVSAPSAVDVSSARAAARSPRASARATKVCDFRRALAEATTEGVRARRDKVCETLARMRSSASQVRAERQVIVVARALAIWGAFTWFSVAALYWLTGVTPSSNQVRRNCPIGPGGVAQGESECFACIRSRVQIPAPPTRFFLFCVGSCVCVVLGCVFVGVVCFVFRFVISDRVVKGKRKRQ